MSMFSVHYVIVNANNQHWDGRGVDSFSVYLNAIGFFTKAHAQTIIDNILKDVPDLRIEEDE